MLVPWIFDYYTKLGFSPAHKIHKIHALRRVSASSALSSFVCYRGLVSVGLRVPTSAIASNENSGVPTRMSPERQASRDQPSLHRRKNCVSRNRLKL